MNRWLALLRTRLRPGKREEGAGGADTVSKWLTTAPALQNGGAGKGRGGGGIGWRSTSVLCAIEVCV